MLEQAVKSAGVWAGYLGIEAISIANVWYAMEIGTIGPESRTLAFVIWCVQAFALFVAVLGVTAYVEVRKGKH
jgi:hypothetical protein